MRDVSERRSERRRSVFLRAKVSWPGLAGSMECSIQDASRSGCQIMSEAIDLLPDLISLTFCGLGETFDGRIVWREGDSAGVQFFAQDEDPPA